MTIEKGQAWGAVVSRPVDVRFVDDDAAVVEAISDGSDAPVAVAGGDLHRTVGSRNPRILDELLELPIDLLHVELDTGLSRRACAHVVIEAPRLRGGWWREDVVMIMNAEFLGDWHIVARGHPNDGRAESCGWGSDFGIRQRWSARARLPTNSHVPHPQIETRSFKERTWEFARPMRVAIDGVPAGTARRIAVRVEPDAAIVYA